MECADFLDGYSAYRDGRLDPGRAEGFREHLESCRSCARYDRVVSRGTEILRELPRPEPSPDFLARLRHRIYHVRDGIPMAGGPQGGVAAVAVAAVGLLAFAWLPFATQVPVEVELPAVAVEEPERAVEGAGRSGPDASSVDMSTFFEPGLLGDGDGAGEAAGWYRGGLWSTDGAAAAPALGTRRGGVSFLAVTRGPTAPGR